MSGFARRVRRKLVTSTIAAHLSADPQDRFPGGPRVRPARWAQPVIGTGLENLHRVDDSLYRSGHPEASDLPTLRALGIRSIASLREYHDDDPAFAEAGIHLARYKLATGSVQDHLAEVLRGIRDLPKPLLVHCWHGSDRTGFLVAGYRIAFQEWTSRDAAEEFALGDYGYHAKTFPHIVKHLLGLDEAALREAARS